MAGEIAVSASLAFTKGNVQTRSLAIAANIRFDAAGSRYTAGVMNVPTTAGGTTIPLAELTGGTLGWYFFKNVDPTNFIVIMAVISTGVVMIKMFPGEIATARFGAGITAPAALADTLAALLELLIIEA